MALYGCSILLNGLNLLTPKSAKDKKSSIIFQTSFCKILKNEWYHAKVLQKRFHLNGHTIGFCPQSQKLERQLELHYMSPYLTLGVKVLKVFQV